VRTSAAQTILELAEADPTVFLITGDAGFGVWEEYQARFPDRYLNLGIAEQNTIGFAAGLAMTGYKVIVYNIAPFVLYRCYEQVRNDICYQRVPVILIGTGSGVAYAPGGMTHYALEDIALARTLPNLQVFSPADPVEVRSCLLHAARHGQPAYVRIAKTGEPVIHSCREVEITRPLVIRDGTDMAILFHGSIAGEVLAAAAGMSAVPRLISVPMLQPLDEAALETSLEGIQTILTVEEHFVVGGLGTIIADWIAAEQRPFRLKKLGFPHCYIHDVNKTAGLRVKYGLDAPGICRAVEEVYAYG